MWKHDMSVGYDVRTVVHHCQSLAVYLFTLGLFNAGYSQIHPSSFVSAEHFAGNWHLANQLQIYHNKLCKCFSMVNIYMFLII